MRIKTGETATTSLTVDLLWVCSHCKAPNLSIDTIQSKAHTATVMGINVDGDMGIAAAKKLYDKIDAVADSNHPHRFRIAQFDCCCSHCGHKEPWAKMNYDRFEKVKTFCKYVISISIVLLAFCLEDISSDFSLKHVLLFAALALGIIANEYLEVYMVKNNKKQELLISSLPQESLPIILPYSKERHIKFKDEMSSHLNK